MYSVEILIPEVFLYISNNGIGESVTYEISCSNGNVIHCRDCWQRKNLMEVMGKCLIDMGNIMQVLGTHIWYVDWSLLKKYIYICFSMVCW